MCNLYDIGRALRHRSRDDWEDAVARALKDSRKSFGIRKTDPGLVLSLKEGSPTAATMRWGFQRAFNPAINNARSDKLDGMWAGAWQRRQRCLIPVATFYEWTGPPGNKQTYAFEPATTENLLWAAGIWEPASDGSHYAMITTEALGPVAKIHNRMPAFLDPARFEEFLTAADPRVLLGQGDGNLEPFRCENPLKDPARHEGPVRQSMLPGFE